MEVCCHGKECEEKDIDIPVPGGSEVSRALDKRYHLENYVRLSYVHKHPMMFAAVEDGRIDDPVILEIDLGILTERKFKFSDSNAASNDVCIGVSKEFLDDNVRFELFYEKYYDLEDYERAFYQAEILIEGFVPISYISNITDFVDETIPNLIEHKSEPESQPKLGLRDAVLEIFNDENVKNTPKYEEIAGRIKRIAERTPNISISIPDEPEIPSIQEIKEKHNYYDDRQKGEILMMILFGVGYVGWIIFVIYCIIYRWKDVQWYDYIWGILLGLLGGFVVIGLPCYLIYWILSKLDLVEPID